MSESAEPDIPLPAIVVCLRIVGVLCPITGFIWAGTNNMDTGPGTAVVLASLIVSLLWFALGSVVRLLNRIETHLRSTAEAGRAEEKTGPRRGEFLGL
jgi:hypothetical protein